MTEYALKFTCHEFRHPSTNQILTLDGTRVWLVGATESLLGFPTSRIADQVPENLFTFQAREAAREFAENWQGHDWTIKPKAGQYEIIEVTPIYKTERVGWELT